MTLFSEITNAYRLFIKVSSYMLHLISDISFIKVSSYMLYLFLDIILPKSAAICYIYF
jgi:hypothetical protein